MAAQSSKIRFHNIVRTFADELRVSTLLNHSWLKTMWLVYAWLRDLTTSAVVVTGTSRRWRPRRSNVVQVDMNQPGLTELSSFDSEDVNDCLEFVTCFCFPRRRVDSADSFELYMKNGESLFDKTRRVMTCSSDPPHGQRASSPVTKKRSTSTHTTPVSSSKLYHKRKVEERREKLRHDSFSNPQDDDAFSDSYASNDYSLNVLPRHTAD